MAPALESRAIAATAAARPTDKAPPAKTRMPQRTVLAAARRHRQFAIGKSPASALLKVNVARARPIADSAAEAQGLETPGKTFASTSRSPRAGQGDPDGTESPPTAEEVRTPSAVWPNRAARMGLPGDHQRGRGVTDPFGCLLRHYLVVMREPGERLPSQLICAGLSHASAVDLLVTTIHQSIDSWGIAGRGMYWRPTLVLEVAPNGKPAQRSRELLADSGIDVREKGSGAAPPPPSGSIIDFRLISGSRNMPLQKARKASVRQRFVPRHRGQHGRHPDILVIVAACVPTGRRKASTMPPWLVRSSR